MAYQKRGGHGGSRKRSGAPSLVKGERNRLQLGNELANLWHARLERLVRDIAESNMAASLQRTRAEIKHIQDERARRVATLRKQPRVKRRQLREAGVKDKALLSEAHGKSDALAKRHRKLRRHFTVKRPHNERREFFAEQARERNIPVKTLKQCWREYEEWRRDLWKT
jgi:hypothetical protein